MKAEKSKHVLISSPTFHPHLFSKSKIRHSLKNSVFEMIYLFNQHVYAHKKTAAFAAVSPSQGNIFSNYKKVNKHFEHLFVRDYSTKLAKSPLIFKSNPIPPPKES